MCSPRRNAELHPHGRCAVKEIIIDTRFWCFCQNTSKRRLCDKLFLCSAADTLLAAAVVFTEHELLVQ